MENKTQRFMNLEGLRGVAALIVVLYHMVIMFYPGIAYGHNPHLAPVQNMRFEDNLYGNPLNVFLSGNFAVGVFFVLSGFVLSIGFFQTGKESLIKKMASKRYLRLMIPALASILLSLLLLFLNFDTFRNAATAITHSGTPGIRGFSPDIFAALQQGVAGIFFNLGTFNQYNPVLWTMSYEFIGSFLVFVFLFMFGKAKYRWVLYALLAAATFGTWLIGFILGMAIADFYVNGKDAVRKRIKLLGWGILGAGLFFGGYPVLETKGTIYNFLNMPWMVDGSSAVYVSIGAALVVMAVLTLPSLSKLFGSQKVSWLGKYTYSLYLTHYLILITLGMALFVFFSQRLGFNKAVVVSMILTTPVIAIVAWLFERYVDRTAIRFSGSFVKIIHGTEKLAIGQKLMSWKVVVVEKLRSSRIPEMEE